MRAVWLSSLLLLLLGVGLTRLHPIQNGDIYWQLKIGQIIIDDLVDGGWAEGRASSGRDS